MLRRVDELVYWGTLSAEELAEAKRANVRVVASLYTDIDDVDVWMWRRLIYRYGMLEIHCPLPEGRAICLNGSTIVDVALDVAANTHLGGVAIVSPNGGRRAAAVAAAYLVAVRRVRVDDAIEAVGGGLTEEQIETLRKLSRP